MAQGKIEPGEQREAFVAERRIESTGPSGQGIPQFDTVVLVDYPITIDVVPYSVTKLGRQVTCQALFVDDFLAGYWPARCTTDTVRCSGRFVTHIIASKILFVTDD